MMLVHLVRHTSVVIDGSIVCYGDTDVDVRETFPQEANKVKKEIEDLFVEAAFSSPLRRASMLARYCGRSDIQYDHRLREMNFGLWELRPWSEIIANEDPATFFSTYLDKAVPGGESLLEQQARVADFLFEKKAQGYSAIVVFCHGGVINCARALAGGFDLIEAFDHLPAFGSITSIEF